LKAIEIAAVAALALTAAALVFLVSDWIRATRSRKDDDL
jgi:hypothetical protein